MEKLLICIPYAYTGKRIHRYPTFKRVLETFLFTYKLDVKVVISTNSPLLKTHVYNDFANELNSSKIEINIPDDLQSPLELLWSHRKIIKERYMNYDYIMRCDDDLEISYDLFKRHMENFDILWPKYVPCVAIYEKRKGSDIKWYSQQTQELHKECIYRVKGRNFYRLLNDYGACWAMPVRYFKTCITPDFVRQGYSAELSSAYPSWELDKPCLIELDSTGTAISKTSVLFHIPSDFAEKFTKTLDDYFVESVGKSDYFKVPFTGFRLNHVMFDTLRKYLPDNVPHQFLDLYPGDGASSTYFLYHFTSHPDSHIYCITPPNDNKETLMKNIEVHQKTTKVTYIDGHFEKTIDKIPDNSMTCIYLGDHMRLDTILSHTVKVKRILVPGGILLASRSEWLGGVQYSGGELFTMLNINGFKILAAEGLLLIAQKV